MTWDFVGVFVKTERNRSESSIFRLAALQCNEPSTFSEQLLHNVIVLRTNQQLHVVL